MVGKGMAVRRAVVLLAGVALAVASVALAPVAGAVPTAPHPRAIGSSPASSPSAGTISTFAQNFIHATDLTAGPDGNVWFVDQRALGSAAVGRITPAGVVTLFSGSGMVSPSQLVVGPDGNIWFTDGGANGVGRINVTTGAISMFSGAAFDTPQSLIDGPDGRLWFASNGNDTVVRMSTTGTATTYATVPAGAVTAGPDGNIWVVRDGSITKMTTAGVVKGTFTDASIQGPGGMVVGSDGRLWFANSPLHGSFSIDAVTLAGVITSYTDPSVVQPEDLLAGPDGALWYLDMGPAPTVGTITTAGVVSSFTDPSFTILSSLAVGPDADLWVTDEGNNSIDTLTTAGVVTVSTDPSIVQPTSILAGPGSDLWFANLSSIGTSTTAGVASAFLGTQVFDPTGITSGSDGDIWFTNGADSGQPGGSPQVSIGRLTPTGTLTTFTDPGLSNPGPIVAGPDGNLWVADTGTDKVDSVTTAGVITIGANALGGTPTAMAVGPDGALWVTIAASDEIDRVDLSGVVTPFTDAGIQHPDGITAGPDGALWFVNGGSSTSIGRITTVGTVSTFTDAAINGPTAITSGPDGALWFTQTNGTVGRITTAGAVSTFPSPSVSGGAIATGADGNLWFTGAAVGTTGPTVARVTPAGVVTTYGTGNLGGTSITAGPAGTMWFPNAFDNSVSSVATGSLGDSFHALAPSRILDSRPGGGNIGGYTTPWGAGVTREVAVTGGASGVPSNADAVVLNVTVTGASSPSFLSVYPSGATPTTVSDLNFSGGQTIANQVTVKVGAGGKVSVLNHSGQVDVIADVTGYYSSATGEGFTSLSPARILDSRPGVGNTGGYATPWGPSTSRDVFVGGRGGVPSNAAAVVLNVTVTDTDASSFLSVWPQGSSRPTVSNINWAPHTTIANAVTVKLNAVSGEVSVYNLAGDANVVIDVAGYFVAGSGDLFHPLTPARVLDSRPGTLNYGAYTTPWGAGTSRNVDVAPLAGVLPSADAVVANVTVTNTTGGSFLTVWPQGSTRPTASSLNWAPGVTIPNAVTVKLGAGQVSVYNFSGSVDVLTDVGGWYG